MSSFWAGLSQLRTILDTETDYDSPGAEELLHQIRENIEVLFMLIFDTGVSGTVDSVSGDTLTDTGNFSTDEHNGRTLLITSGQAKGYIYTIDDTTTDTLICTGDNLQTDGVAASDTYKILHDLKVNADGHDHDGVTSAELNAAVGQAQLKTSTEEESTNSDNYVYTALSSADSYSFWPETKVTSGSDSGSGDVSLEDITEDGTYRSAVSLRNSTVSTSYYTYARFRYITASGPLYWLWVLKKPGQNFKDEIMVSSLGADHPCFNRGEPQDFPHPFYCCFDESTKEMISYDDKKQQVRRGGYEIFCCSFTEEEYAALHEEMLASPYDSILEMINETYQFDELSNKVWPSDTDITVGLELNPATGKQQRKKAKIAQPSNVNYHPIKKLGA